MTASKTQSRTQPEKKAEPTPVIEVVGPREGFRRAGRRFGPEATVIPVADLTDDQLTGIETEPALVSIRRELVDD